MKLLMTLITLSLLMIGCSHHEHHHMSKVTDQKLDTMTTKNYKHLYLGAQPTTKDLKKAKEVGIVHVINLRTKKDKHYSAKQMKREQMTAKKLGMKYVNIPFSPCHPNKKTFDQIEKYLKANHGEKTLIHCASGNRAAAWLASHVHKMHDADVDESIELGNQAGLTNDRMRKIIEFYMGGKTGEINQLKGCTDKK